MSVRRTDTPRRLNRRVAVLLANLDPIWDRIDDLGDDLNLDETTTLDPARVVEFVHETRGRLRLTDDMKLIYSLKPDESARPLQTTRDFVEKLLTYRAGA